jgi:hypothetical protein
MRISQSKIQNVDRFLLEFKKDEHLYIIVDDLDSHKDRLIQVGFSSLIPIGEKILPSALFGTVSDFNANGKYEKLRDQPKETYYKTQSATIKAYGKHDVHITKQQPYKKFQVELTEVAPSIELAILLDSSNEKIVSSDELIYNETNKNLIKHTINLFLEIFGECVVVDNEFLSKQKTKIKKVSWNILPKGVMPWAKLREPLIDLLEKTAVEDKEDTLRRFEFINSFSPDFVATGNGGFNDYVVFGFEDRNLYVLENSFAGNATYIFNNDWETLSQLSKAEILAENLQEHRLIHKKYWKRSIKDILIIQCVD